MTSMDDPQPDSSPKEMDQSRLPDPRLDQLFDNYVAVGRELHERDELFQLLISNVRDYAIFVLDPHGHIATWNTGAQLIKGYTASEVIGRHFSIFFPPEDIASGKPQRALETAARDGRYQDENWRVRKDGTRFWASIVITALYDQVGQLRGFGKVTRDMTQQKQAEQARAELNEREHQLALEREARAQVEATLRSRDEFLMVAAHELRTPMTSLLGYAQLLQRRFEQGKPGLETAQRVVHAIVEQAKRVNRLTTMLLDLTRLERGTVTLKPTLLDLRAEVARIAEQFRLLSERHTLDLALPDDPVMISVDELSLEQILYNLFQNATKFSPLGGTIMVDVRRDQQHAILAIADPGIGIPAEDLAHVFERFYRARNVTSNEISGLGIGLYMVKELVTLHNGTVSVQSTPGQGSIFTVTLPLGE
jgi:PAS domain S-box-containing protein